MCDNGTIDFFPKVTNLTEFSESSRSERNPGIFQKYLTFFVFRMEFDKTRWNAHIIMTKTVHKTLPRVLRFKGIGGERVGVKGCWGQGTLGLGVVGSNVRGVGGGWGQEVVRIKG